MQILVAGPGQDAAPLAVTMRTPGHDFELAAGFVLTEGVASREEIGSVDYCEAVDRSDPAIRYNHVTVRLTKRWEPHREPRYFAASSSCGMCGKATVEQIETGCRVVADGEPFPARLIPTLPDLLRESQKAFDRTGGLHAAGLFRHSGELCFAREDVGRHNAVDKVVGATILGTGFTGPAHPRPIHPRPIHPGPVSIAAPEDHAGADHGPTDMALVISGRISFEIVQKAAMGGIGLIAAVSAPSSLAVQAATRLGVSLVAFVRGETYNVYAHPERIDFSL